MPVKVETQNVGNSTLASEIVAVIEHAFSDRAGEWNVCIIGSRANDDWEMKLAGPQGFERSYILVGAVGQHEPTVIQRLIPKLLPASNQE